MSPLSPANEFLRPIHHSISEMVPLIIFNMIFLVLRRARTFAAYKADSSLGWRGVVIVPVRFAAKAGFWLFGFFTLTFFVIEAQDFSFNIAVLAVLMGFAMAYGINYLISRCEQKLYPREENGRARPVRDS